MAIAAPIVRQPTKVETAASLAGAWTDQPALEPVSGSAGGGQVAGEFAFRVVTGVGRRAGTTGAGGTLSPVTNINGKFIRVSAYDAVSAAFVPFWYGTVDAYDLQDEGAGRGGQIIHATGLAAGLLGKTYVNRGWITTGVGGTATEQFSPPFNLAPYGDRSSSKVAADGVNAYIHQLFTSANSKWRAVDILESLLGRLANINIVDVDGGLTYDVSTIDFDGWSLLDVVNYLINARRGLTWTFAVVGGVVSILSYSISASAVTVGPYTLPAATLTATVNTTSIDFTDVTVRRDDSMVVDEIRVYGARPWVGMTVAYEDSPDEALTAGWVNAADVERYFRRFAVYSGWDSHQFGSVSVGLRNALTLSSDAYTGARTFSTGSATGDPRGTLEFTSELPCGEGWTASLTGPRQKASAWLYNGTTYIDATSSQDSAGLGLSLSVEREREPAIALGTDPDDGLLVKAIVDVTGGLVLASVGVREAAPLLVSWYRAGTLDRSNRRVLEVRLPECEQWLMLEGTVKTASGATATTYPSTVTLRDDLPRMQATLALMRAYYDSPSYDFSWSKRGIDFTDTYGPGTLITTATTGHGALTLNNVVTRQAWNFDTYTTSFTTARVVPELGAIR
jgi:hypothetical protein